VITQPLTTGGEPIASSRKISGDGWSLRSIKGCCGSGSGSNTARSRVIRLPGCLVSVIMGFSSIVSRPVLKFSRPKDWAFNLAGAAHQIANHYATTIIAR